MKETIRTVATVAAVLIGIGTALAGFVVLPHQVRAHDLRITSLERREVENRELLVRIEERVIQLQRSLQKDRTDRTGWDR